jgi:arabinan endo-1,5-alpha-L-arabinosidase
MVFTDEGWPVVSPERYAGETEQPVPDKDLEGVWEYLPIDPGDNSMQQAVPGLVFGKNNELTLGNQKGTWQVTQPNSLRFTLGSSAGVSAKILPAWDWENNRKTLVFTGLDENGTAVWGKKRESE